MKIKKGREEGAEDASVRVRRALTGGIENYTIVHVFLFLFSAFILKQRPRKKEQKGGSQRERRGKKKTCEVLFSREGEYC